MDTVMLMLEVVSAAPAAVPAITSGADHAMDMPDVESSTSDDGALAPALALTEAVGDTGGDAEREFVLVADTDGVLECVKNLVGVAVTESRDGDGVGEAAAVGDIVTVDEADATVTARKSMLLV